MALSLVGTPTSTTTGIGAATASITCNVPTGVADGDLLLWFVVQQNVTNAAVPAGWTATQVGSTTALSTNVWQRVASSEPASYTATVTSARTVSVMIAIRGADTTTPKDVASSATVGTTATTFGANTPVTAGAWVFGFGGQQFASGVTPGTVSSTNLTLDLTPGTNAASAANVAAGVGHFVWTSGAFTPAMANSAATARTIGITVTIRPAAVTATARARNIKSYNPAIVRSVTF